MKQLGFTFMLFVIVLSPLAAACQGLPDGPAPASDAAENWSGTGFSSSGQAQEPGPAPSQPVPPPNPQWRKIQRLPHGELIVVHSTEAPALQCRFAGATDAELFCDAAGSPDGSGYRFERASVLSVEEMRPQHNWHPFLIASVVGIGVLMGARVASDTDAETGAGAGAASAAMALCIGAAVVAGQESGPGFSVVYRPRALRFHPRGPVGLRPRAIVR